MSLLEQKNLPENGFLDNITKWLKELMDKVKSWLDEILVKLWLKKQEEIKNTIEDSQKELGDLLLEVNNEFKDDGVLSEKEKETINKNQETKNYYDWLKKEFWEEVANKEIHVFLSKFKEFAKDSQLSNDEEKELKTYISNQKEKIEKDENLKKIVKEITESKDEKKWTNVEKIIIAYEEIKWEDENKNPTKLEVLAKLEEEEK